MEAQRSGSFERLHPKIQQWIWQRRWDELRDAQERAIPIILEGGRDLVIAAATASGKTEAAFLPIASKLIEQGDGLALYISPLKALINDQCARMEDLFGACELPVYPWHGDVGASKKAGFEKNPRGVLLITPESLESIFVRRGFYLASTFRFLSVVVVDELHTFINTERGMQLASLLCRLETVLGRRVQRVGLSATLGDMRAAADFLRPAEGGSTEVIESTASGQELKLLVKGYEEPIFDPAAIGESEPHQEQEDGIAAISIARDLFKALKGSKNLIFANSRRRVEEFTDRLIGCCEAAHVPNEFYAHHASLSKSFREEVESILKESDRPASAVCTSTLEMGIDIGQVRSVAQIDAPWSVASLRQRMGRSGRRGEAAILRMFVTESKLQGSFAVQDRLRLDLFQAVAVTNLLLAKWCEPPTQARIHLSTLIQQVLSLVAQYGGITAKEAWQIACQRGPFRNVDPQMFAELLRSLGSLGVLTQAADGTLLHGPVGEQIVNHYSFYTAFWPSEEYQVVHGNAQLGTLPVSQPIAEKSLILFGGRRWRVIRVDENVRIIEVLPAHAGRAPNFSGGGGRVHRRVHEEMYRLYQSSEVPAFLDQQAIVLLKEGREEFEQRGLEHVRVIGDQDGSALFLWTGDLVSNTLLVQLRSTGLFGLSFGVGLWIEGVDPSAVESQLSELAATGSSDAASLAQTVPNRRIDRYDSFLPDDLLSRNYASAELDTDAMLEAVRTSR